MSHRVVIVGAGFAGLSAAKRLKGAPADITLVDKSNYHLFQPLLYQVATAGLSPADIAYPIRSVLRGSTCDVLMAEVTGVDTAHRAVRLADRSLPYDFLILATGATHSYFGHDEWARFAPGLKTIADAVAIRKQILLAFERAEMEQDEKKKTELLTFIIVGGGPTGVELAGAISELAYRALAKDFRHIDPRSTKILLIEAGPRILASFPEKLSERATRALKKLRVEVLTQSRVEKIDAQGAWLQGKLIPAANLIWAAGVTASPIARWINAKTDPAGRVIVDERLHPEGHPEIFVLGDVARVLREDGTPLPGIAPVAMQQGNYAARQILARLKGKKFEEAFHYWDKGNLATVGRRFAVADIGRFHLSGFLAWVVWTIVHIYYLIGFRNRILVMMQWAWAYLTFQRGARLIADYERGKNE